MSREVVFDIETQNSFQDIGENTPAKLAISLVGIYRYDTGALESYRFDELDKLWPILESADRLIGYNSLHFDLPLLNRYYKAARGGDLATIDHCDLMAVVSSVLGFRLKLDHLAQATLGTAKSGTGLMAITYFKEGRWDELARYCLDDVKITKDLYEQAKANRTLYYQNFKGEKIAIPVAIPPLTDRPAMATAGASAPQPAGRTNLRLGL